MYEASQGSASRIKDINKKSGERIDALAAEKEALKAECESLRQRLTHMRDELERVERGKEEAEEMLARAEESIRDEQAPFVFLCLGFDASGGWGRSAVTGRF